MKNIYLFFVILFITGCESSNISDLNTKFVSCPPVLFSSEHKIYFGISSDDFSIDDLTFRAEINNALFTKECKINDDVFVSDLSILFIINPLVEKLNSIDLPFYIAILDQNKELVDIHYLSTNKKTNINLQTDSLIETEIIENLLIKSNKINKFSTIIIGFILEKKRLKILN